LIEVKKMNRLNVAMIGQGRSGRDIHGSYFLREDNQLFQVVAVVEKNVSRRIKAKETFSCDVYEDYKELFDRKDIDLVVNSTFSYLHPSITIDLLNHGYNVLCEKPFARFTKECDEMMEAAKKSGAKLAVFQQSRFAPYFVKIKEIINSGVLGDIIQINVTFSGYARRWDWQCAQKYYGGSLLNTGPHPMDQALNLLQCDTMPQVFSKLARVNTSGDAEDYVKVILTAPAKPLIDIEISSCDGYPDGTYKIQGSKGALRATMTEVEWKYFIPENEPKRALILEPLCKENGDPAYCSEQLTWHTETTQLEGSAFDVAVNNFYENLYYHLTENTPLAVSLAEVRQQIAVIEEIHRQNPLSVTY
jgi:Predicted dehydrogenases and related proteins